MKNFKILALMAFVLISASGPVQSNYSISKDYTVTIHGTSNLHDWNETVKTVTGSSSISWNSDGSFNLDALTINMNVRSIKSTEGAVMNNNTYKALKADVCPEIIFTLSAPVKSLKTDGAGTTISAGGNLTIAGVTKSVIMQVKAYMPTKDTMQFEGLQSIKMTEYGITPPTALFGVLKTGDVITIDFKTTFTPNNFSL